MEENARSGTTGEEARAVGENFGDVGLSLTKNGTVKQTISNCVVALRTDEKTQDMEICRREDYEEYQKLIIESIKEIKDDETLEFIFEIVKRLGK